MAAADPIRSSRPTVLVAEPEGFNPAAADRLREVADVTLRKWPSQALAEALDTYDVFWFRLGYRLDEATLAEARRVRIVATPVTGLDQVDLDACARFGIRVLSLRDETEFLRDVRATAELTVGLALALLRRIPQAAADVRLGRWDRDAFRGHELFGATAGIIGLGRLGTIVAGYLQALGMSVVGYDVDAPTPPGVERVGDLRELLARSDLVSLHARYEPATHHLLDARALSAVKPGAVLVNTARGGLLDDIALINALESGRLAGAALDVVEGEPDIGTHHPLVAYARGHDNLLIVPHIGGSTYESVAKTERFLADRVVDSIRSGLAVEMTRP